MRIIDPQFFLDCLSRVETSGPSSADPLDGSRPGPMETMLCRFSIRADCWCRRCGRFPPELSTYSMRTISDGGIDACDAAC
jgi:hypothetical protein